MNDKYTIDEKKKEEQGKTEMNEEKITKQSRTEAKKRTTRTDMEKEIWRKNNDSNEENDEEKDPKEEKKQRRERRRKGQLEQRYGK